MKVIPIKKEDLLTELGKNSRLIKLTVEAKGTSTYEVSNMSVGNIIDNMTNQNPDEFFFKIEEDKDNE